MPQRPRSFYPQVSASLDGAEEQPLGLLQRLPPQLHRKGQAHKSRSSLSELHMGSK